MRHRRRKYSRSFALSFCALSVLVMGYVILSSFRQVTAEEPKKPEKVALERTADLAALDLASVSGEASAQPTAANGSLQTFIDWAIWYAGEEPAFPVEADGTTVYGDLFGNPTAQWCTEFLMYSLQKAEDHLGTQYLENAYPWCDSAYASGLWFKARSRFFDPEGYTPSRGDLVFFDTYSSGYPDHIGTVTDVFYDNAGVLSIRTIEGNILTDEIPQIRSREMAADASIVLGYGSMYQYNDSYSGPLDDYSSADAPNPVFSLEENRLWYSEEKDDESEFSLAQ